MNTMRLSRIPRRANVLPRSLRPARALDAPRPWRLPRHAELRLSRAFDATIAGLLLVLLALPMLLVALLVRLSSRGPALYQQERTGLDGETFVMYKFRTMREDAERETGPVWASLGDPRCTRLGNFLRRFGIDELPQLLNVLRGEMSLVGPRPERPYFVQAFSQRLPGYNRRHQVLPGITGWAQVNGWRGDTSIEQRLDCDLYYVEHWSLWFNLLILLKTPYTLLAGQDPR